MLTILVPLSKWLKLIIYLTDEAIVIYRIFPATSNISILYADSKYV